MKNKLLLTKLATTIGLLLAGTSVFAYGTRFADFTPVIRLARPSTKPYPLLSVTRTLPRSRLRTAKPSWPTETER